MQTSHLNNLSPYNKCSVIVKMHFATAEIPLTLEGKCNRVIS